MYITENPLGFPIIKGISNYLKVETIMSYILQIVSKFRGNSKVGVFFRYSMVKYIALGFAFIKDIINAKYLGPELLGLLGNLMLIFRYLTYSDLGILYSMSREYPLALSESTEKANKVLSSTYTFLLYESIAIFGITILLSNSLFDNTSLVKSEFIILLVGAAILEQLNRYFINYYRLKEEFKKLNNIEMLKNSLLLVLVIVLINKYQVIGILWSMLISSTVSLVYANITKKDLKLGIEKGILSDLIKVGVPLLVYNLGFYILTTVDRLMIIKYLDYESLGYYTFASQMGSATLMFITSVLYLEYPKAIRQLNSNTTSSVDSTNYMLKNTKYIEIFGILLAVLGMSVMYPFVGLFLKGYETSIAIYTILISGVIFTRAVYFYNVYLVSNNHQSTLVIMQFISVVLAIIGNYIFIKLGMGILGVALATSIVNIVYSILQVLYANRILSSAMKPIETIKLLKKMVVFFLVVATVTFVKNNGYVIVLLSISVSVLLYWRDILKIVKEKQFTSIN